MEVSDTMTDYGLVGVIIVDSASIVQMVMSCRVVGLEVEVASVALVVALLRQGGHLQVAANLVHTKANLLCRDLWEKCGFNKNGAQYFLPRNQNLNVPAHIAVVDKSMYRSSRSALKILASQGALAGEQLRQCLVAGWSSPEAAGSWAIGLEHKITFEINDYAKYNSVDVILTFGAFLDKNCPEQRILVSVENVLKFEKSFGLAVSHFKDVEMVVRLTGPRTEVLLQTPDAKSPYACGLNNDRRELSLILKKARFVVCSGADSTTGEAVHIIS